MRVAPRLIVAIAAAVTAAACASTRPAASPEAAVARGSDDFALQEQRDSLGPLEGHFVAVAGGNVLGGSMLLEDTASLLAALRPEPEHAYLFRAGEQGDRQESIPILYGKRVAGNALLAALGVKITHDPGAGTLTMARGEVSKVFSSPGAASASFLVRSASGLGPARHMEMVVATGYAGTALLDTDNAEQAGLVLSEIPGTVRVTESLSGKVLECRRAWARVEVPEVGAVALVEVLFTK